MPNPYYIAPDNTRMQNFLGLAGLATQLYGMKQRGDIAETEAGMGQEANRIKLQDVTQRGVEAERIAKINEEKNAIERDKLNNANFGYGDEGIVKIFAKGVGISEKSTLMQQVHQFAVDKNVTKEVAWKTLRSNEEYQQSAIEDIQKKMAAESSKNQNYMDSKEAKRDYEILQRISTKEGWAQAVDNVPVFSPLAAREKQGQLAAEAAANKERYKITDAGLFDTRTRTLVTGTEKRFAPQRPVSVGPGATLVDPTDNKTIYTNMNQPAGANRPVSVAPGATLVSPTGKPVYTAPGATDKTGTWQYIGTDEKTGQPILSNTKTGEQKLGDMKVGAKPSSKKGSSVAADLGLKPKMNESDLRADLIKNGYTQQTADEYIKRAKAMGKF